MLRFKFDFEGCEYNETWEESRYNYQSFGCYLFTSAQVYGGPPEESGDSLSGLTAGVDLYTDAIEVSETEIVIF